MTGFDTDVLSDILRGRPDYLVRLGTIPRPDRFVPVVTAGEVIRGRLAVVRAAESGRGPINLVRAYELTAGVLLALQEYGPLAYTAAADQQFRQWKVMKVKVGSNDLRIAAICHTSGVRLATRNTRDFVQVPGLLLDVWN